MKAKPSQVYDVSSRPTFDELLRWFRELDTYCGEGVVKVLVGNKVDKVRLASLLRAGWTKRLTDIQEFSRQVSFDEGQAFADRMGTLFVECSAKTNVGVVDIFQDLVRQVSPRLVDLCRMPAVRGGVLMWDRYCRDPSFGQRVRRRTRRSKSPKMRMTERGGVDVETISRGLR